MSSKIRWMISLGIALVFKAAPVFAATITVMSGADTGGACPGPTCMLRQAIAAAASGDTINFAAGIMTVNLTSGELLINRNLTINGPGANLLTVQRSPAAGTPDFRIFDITGNLTAAISGLTIAHGILESSGSGGGVFVGNQATLTVTNCNISSNAAFAASGGGIYNEATLTLNDCIILGNFALGAGGISNIGLLTLNRCVISGNSIYGNNYGGGIGNSFVIGGMVGRVVMTNSSVTGNTADRGGGGINDYGDFTMSNCTIANNSVTNSVSNGGGAYLGGAGKLKMTNCTVTGNSTSQGVGGVDGANPNVSHSFIISNSIVAGNHTAPPFDGHDIAGAVTSTGHNLIGSTNGSSGWGPTDQTGTSAAPLDPKFDPAGLKDNGGPTQTIGLQASSPAIDAGGSANLATDQRGRARVYDDPATANANGSDGSDIGALEMGPAPGPVTNLNDSGPGSLRDTIPNYFFGGVVTFDPSLSGAIALASPLQINKETTIAGSGNGRIAVSGNNTTRVIDVYSGSLTLSGLDIVNGNDDGIRVHKQGTLMDPAGLTLNNCTISGNTTAGVYLEEGATVTVNNSAFSDNIGSGISNNNGSVAVTNCTFTRNNNSGGGGAIVSFGGSTSVSNSTLSGNSASLGGGLYRFSGGVTVSSSIIAGNTDLNGAPDVWVQSGTITSLGYNLIGDGSGSKSSFVDGVNHDQVGTMAAPIAPGLGPLQDNGGPTFTMALLSGSHALDKGLSNGLTSDQRGSQRIFDDPALANPAGGDGADVGAFELSPSPIVTTNAADNLGASFATLNGSVNPNKLATSVHFDFGSTISYGSITSAQVIGNGTATLAVSANLSGLSANSAYHFRAVATSAGGTVAGSDQVFTTLPATSTPTATPIPTGTAAPTGTPTATPSVTTLANISTRLRVETGDNVLIGGFIVTGTQPKKIIVRAIGPSLPFAGKLDNPTLELRDSTGALLASNDDWMNSSPADKQAIIDSTIPPANELESAIVATLPANGSGYTAIVRGVNNGTGIGVVEAYDLDRSVDSKLANISTRGFVQTGDNVLIAGTIVLGSTAQKVILRAIGPSLPITGKLENPTLELRDSNGGLVEANDNWIDSPNKQAIIDSTVPPTNDLESAIVATLPANGASYTAIVRGVNDTTGIAVVELYALQ